MVVQDSIQMTDVKTGATVAHVDDADVLCKKTPGVLCKLVNIRIVTPQKVKVSSVPIRFDQ
eukprot:6998629-Ditylum_brightwellii.AAC.1